MEDVELVLRFFALKDGGYQTMRKGFKEFLTASLTELNLVGSPRLRQFEEEFMIYMHFLREFGGSKPFAKWRIEGLERRQMSSFNAAVFDAVAVGVAETFSVADIQTDAKAVASRLEGFQDLFANADFFASVSGSVNDAAKFQYRIDAMKIFLAK